MSIRKTQEKDVFSNVTDIALRMYGNGCSYPLSVVNSVTDYCRQRVRAYFLVHNQLMTSGKDRSMFLKTLVYTSRHRRTGLKRLGQFLQAKDRSVSQQEDFADTAVKEKRLTMTDRFRRTCDQLRISISTSDSNEKLDRQRSRQYARLDDYYKSESLTSNAYLVFVEQQHSSFNQLRSLSTLDLLHWLGLNHLHISNSDLRLAEICLFLIKEILLNLMDEVHRSTIPCEPKDIIRRRHVQKCRRLFFSRRKPFPRSLANTH